VANEFRVWGIMDGVRRGRKKGMLEQKKRLKGRGELSKKTWGLANSGGKEERFGRKDLGGGEGARLWRGG